MIGVSVPARLASAGQGVAEFALIRFIRALIREVGDDDVFGNAAEMAYRFLFAVFPLLLMMATALGFVGTSLGLDDLFGRLLRPAIQFLPPRAGQSLEQYVAGLFVSRSPAFLTLGFLGTIWGAAGGVGALAKGLNRAYDIEYPRPFLWRQTLAVITTLVIPTTGLLLFALAMVGQNAADWLGSWLALREEASQALAFARWPVLVVLLILGLSILYQILPNKQHRYIWSLPGSIVATTGWLVLTRAFRIYVANFADYDATYGSFGAVIAFLLWLYLTSVVVLLGAEINSLLEPDGRHAWRRHRSHPPSFSPDPPSG